MNRLAAGVLAILTLGIASCGKAPPPPPPPPPPAHREPPVQPEQTQPPGPPLAAGTAQVTGTVTFVGKPPEMKAINRGADPFCAKTAMKEEEVIVGPGGGLKNVLVRITKGIAGNYEAPMTNATLDQSACMYRPHVQGIMTGQSLLIRNSDQTLHNVHAYKGPSTQFNQAEIPGLPPIAKKFSTSGDVIKFKCDVHPWMTAYVAVEPHPFFAVTGDDGTFTIPKVPAGRYTLEAWHERYGTKTTDIVVEGNKPTEAKFEFGK
jgi:plastocyanin